MAITAQYRFNGEANDASGNGLNLTASNVTYVPGVNGKAANFNGSNAAATATSSAFAINGTQVFSVSALILTAQTFSVDLHNSFISGIFTTPQDGAWDKAFTISRASGVNYFQFVAYDQTNSLTKIARVLLSTLPTTKYFLVTGVFDGTYIKLYIDGVFKEQTACSSSYAETNPSLLLGQRNTLDPTSQFFNGKIDDFIIEKTAWTASAIKNKYSFYKGFF